MPLYAKIHWWARTAGGERGCFFLFFPCSYFLAELNFKKKPSFNLRLIIPFALNSVRGTPYLIPLLEVCPVFRLSVLQAVCTLTCVKRPCRGQGGGDISPDPCTPTHTLFTNCVMAVARKKKKGRKVLLAHSKWQAANSCRRWDAEAPGRWLLANGFSTFSLLQQKAPLSEWSTLAAIAAYPLQCWHFLDHVPNECWGGCVCVCVMHIIWRQARDCWLAIAENRACNTAKERVLSDQFASCFQLSRDYSKFLVLCLGYTCFSACPRKAESVDAAVCCWGRLLSGVCCRNQLTNW